MVKLTFVIGLVLSLINFVRGQPVNVNGAINDPTDNRLSVGSDKAFNGSPPFADLRWDSVKQKSKTDETLSKTKSENVISKRQPVATIAPIGLNNLFGPQGLSSLLQDPRSRLLLSRLGPLLSLDTSLGQQGLRSPRQLPFAGFGGGNGLLNVLNPGGRAPTGFNAGGLLNLLSPQPSSKVGNTLDIIPSSSNSVQGIQGPPPSNIFGQSSETSSSSGDDSNNFFCGLLRFFLSRLF